MCVVLHFYPLNKMASIFIINLLIVGCFVKSVYYICSMSVVYVGSVLCVLTIYCGADMLHICRVCVMCTRCV